MKIKLDTKNTLRINAVIFIAYGIGFIVAPQLMSSMYLKQPEALNGYAYWIMRYLGIANCSLATIYLAIADGAAESMKKCVLSIIAVGNLASAYCAYSKQDWHHQSAFIQLMILQFGLCGINLYVAGIFKGKYPTHQDERKRRY